MEKQELEQKLAQLNTNRKALYEQLLRTEGAIQAFQHLLAEHEKSQQPQPEASSVES